MKYAILADIHANLPAFEAALADSRECKCTHYACAGDIVGYGRQPQECVKIVREMGMPCVKGNHDEYCSCEIEMGGFTPPAAMLVKWTRAQLSEDDRRWLQSLKEVEIVDGFTIVHSTLNKPHNWQYVFSNLDAASNFPNQKTGVCFFGHTHVPMVFIRWTGAEGQQVVKGGTYSKVRVEADQQYFVNPGSVGQPRDNNPKAAYAIYDMERKSIELRRIDYDWKRAASDGGGVNLN